MSSTRHLAAAAVGKTGRGIADGTGRGHREWRRPILTGRDAWATGGIWQSASLVRSYDPRWDREWGFVPLPMGAPPAFVREVHAEA